MDIQGAKDPYLGQNRQVVVLTATQGANGALNVNAQGATIQGDGEKDILTQGLTLVEMVGIILTLMNAKNMEWAQMEQNISEQVQAQNARQEQGQVIKLGEDFRR